MVSDLIQGNITIKRVYYVEGLNHNLFSVGQFCDADLEVAFRKSTCYVRDLKGNDLLTGSRRSDLYSITLQDITYPNLICLMAKATSSQAWLWHRRLSHLNFDSINLLSKNDIVIGSTKNDVVERRDRTLIEAARTMLSAANLPLFFCAEAIALHDFTQNHSLIIPRDEKTSYHIINGQKPTVKFFYIFGSLCYIVRDGENLDKMKEKGDACTFVGLMFAELLNGTTSVVSKSFAVIATDAPNQRQQQNTTPSTSITVASDIPLLDIQTTPETTNQAPTITLIEKIN
ncbi:integrase, catalytic region, zinc finger, CCHC-type containing protein [Tanacetum coccineum]